jgi:hypothetical protein
MFLIDFFTASAEQISQAAYDTGITWLGCHYPRQQ